jgi:hypothetical protein
MGHARLRILLELLLAAATAAGVCACDKRPATPTAAAPATSPSVAPTQPATTQAATRPAVTVMVIDGNRVIFPAARLRLEESGDHFNALLFSDDPPEAIRDTYQGNSFYIQMALDIDDAKSLPGAVWTHKAPSQSEREDTPYGIYLAGRKTQLVPYDVRAKFSADQPIKLMIAGQFMVLRDSARGTALPQTAVVAAEIPLKVDAEKPASK